VHFSATSLKNLFECVDPSAVIYFIKDIHFCDRILFYVFLISMSIYTFYVALVCS